MIALGVVPASCGSAASTTKSNASSTSNAFGTKSISASPTKGNNALTTKSTNAATTKEAVLRLVSTLANATTDWRSTYASIEDTGDGRGYTAGIVGWCSGTGDMLELVKYYASTAPGNPLQMYIPALQKVMAAPYARRPALSQTLLGPAFGSAWATAAGTSEFQAAQRRERDRVYWNPAVAAANADSLSPLGLYIYYDISVNHGPGGDRDSLGGIVAGVKALGYRSPARGGDEVAFLTAVLAARDAVLRSLGEYQVKGQSTIARKFLNEKNLNLTLPLRWSVYGDSYSITKPPKQ